MLIDVRGLNHPEHIKRFKDALEGLCSVNEDVEIILGSNPADLKRFESYIRSCNCRYEKSAEAGNVRIRITAPFSLCG